MAEAKRDRALVSPAMLAWWALQGDEDRQFVRDFLISARKQVGQISRDAYDGALHEYRGFLADLHLFLISMEEAMNSDGGTHLELRLVRRTSGKRGRPRGRSLDRARLISRAASIVDRLVAEGWQVEPATAEAVRLTGASRTQIFERRQKNENLRQALGEQNSS